MSIPITKCPLCGQMKRCRRIKFGATRVRACTECNWRFYQMPFDSQKVTLRNVEQSEISK
jgi:hypothetical protein